jgi:4-alpha-glucanotransferase
MTGHDVQTKRRIGLDPGETDEERQRACAALRAATGGGPASFDNVVSFLASTPTRLVSVSIEDVLDVADQVNVPGTVDQHPNWRRRWPVPLEELGSDQRLGRIAATLARAGRG